MSFPNRQPAGAIMALVGTLLVIRSVIPASAGEDRPAKKLDYRIERSIVIKGFDGQTCWVHTRPGAIPVGAPGNIQMPPDTHAQIRRMNLDGSGVEVVASGVRNTVGFDWNPATKQLWFTDNGRDWMSETVPEDELNASPQRRAPEIILDR